MYKSNSLINKYGRIAAVLLLIAMIYSCKQSNDLPEGLVAQVNDQFLLLDHLQYSVPEGLEDQMALALKKNIIAEWVDAEALYQAALKEGVELNDKERFLVEKYQKSLFIQRYIAQKINRNYNISQRDIENYYRNHREEFIREQDEVHVIHLLLEQRDNAIFAEIRRSDNLMELIKKYYFNEKSTRERPNGDLGYVALSRLSDDFVRTLRRMKTGSISDAVRTDQGYHFFQLLDRQDAGTLRDIELVKNEIILRLQRERREQELERLVKEAKDNAQIQTYLSKIQE